MAIEFPNEDKGPQMPPPVPPETPPPAQPSPLLPAVDANEVRMWSILAHLSVLLNLVTGLLGPVAALLIYLVYRERSRTIAFHALQSLYMQLVLWVGGGLIFIILLIPTIALSFVLIGLCLLPLVIIVGLAPLAAVVYGIVAAIQVDQGQPFRYYMAADWADQSLGRRG